MRIGAVRRLPVHRYLDRVAGRVDRAGVQRDAAPGNVGMDVGGHDRGRGQRRQLTVGELLRSGGIGLLAGLEDRQQRRRKLVGERMRRSRQRDQCCHVNVVPAGVHHVVVRAEGRAGALLQRQAVQLGAHGDRGLPGADTRDQPGRGDGP